jgi:hypothetical protein
MYRGTHRVQGSREIVDQRLLSCCAHAHDRAESPVFWALGVMHIAATSPAREHFAPVFTMFLCQTARSIHPPHATASASS